MPYALSVMRCGPTHLAVKITSRARERVFSRGGKAFSSLLVLAIMYALGRFVSETVRRVELQATEFRARPFALRLALVHAGSHRFFECRAMIDFVANHLGATRQCADSFLHPWHVAREPAHH